jgi:type I restriction enzyme M protein
MNLTSQQIVQKLWHYCNLLRDDGLSYPDYVEQLTYLIFLKMSHERDDKTVPPSFSWPTLLNQNAAELHAHYSTVLSALGKQPGMLGLIFGSATNKIQDPAKLRRLVVELIDREQWTTYDSDIKGDAYEGLLEKTARDSKSGAGQYFTPRALIRAIIEVIRPGVEESTADPACGTCGFLLGVREYVVRTNPAMSRAQQRRQRLQAYYGVELVQSVARLGAMNLLLHGIGPIDENAAPPIEVRDSLSAAPTRTFDIVLTNPPFGKKSSVRISRDQGEEGEALTTVRRDFWTSTANKQLNFLQHVRSMLRPGGRAAVVIPDNVLFEGGSGEIIRRELIRDCNVHTLLRLPTGLFYAQGVKANVLFFHRGNGSKTPATRVIWVYDLRTNMRFTLRTKQLQQSHLDEFVALYSAGNFAARSATWSSLRTDGRWRGFAYEDVIARPKCNLDLSWIRDAERVDRDRLPRPDILTAEIAQDLRDALKELESMGKEESRGRKRPSRT